MARSKTHFMSAANRNIPNRMWGMQDLSLERPPSQAFHDRGRRTASCEPVPVDPTIYVRPAGEYALDLIEGHQQADPKKQETQASSPDMVIDLTDQDIPSRRGVLALVGVSLELETPYSELVFPD